MKFQRISLLGLGAFSIQNVVGQECPAGYSMSTYISYVTVTAAPTTTIYTSSTVTSTYTVVASNDADPAGTDVAATGVASVSPVNAVEGSSAATSAASTPTAAATSTAGTTSLGSVLSGQATTYGGNVAGGACSFSTYTLPSGIFGTALSDSNWDDAANCGACISVTGPSGNVIAMIVDECPGCGLNHLDLFPDAFQDVTGATTGIIDVTWEYTSCPITSAITLVSKSGASQYWFSMQVDNANEPVSTLEVSTDGGSTWLSTTRQTYNFFEIESGTGTTTVDVKVSSTTGKTITVNNVSVAGGSTATANSNF